MTELRPELRRALELALPEPSAPYGLKGRVRRALSERLDSANKRRARFWLCFVALAALSLGVLVGQRFSSHPTSSTKQGSLLELRSARAILRPDTELIVERDDERGASLRLVSGVVLIHVQKGTGRRFELFAGASRVEVVGTIFGVSRRAAEGVAVEVVEGVVRVADPSGERRLSAGQRWPSGATLFDSASELSQLRAPISVVSSASPAPNAAAAPAAQLPAPASAASSSVPATASSPSASSTLAAEDASSAEAQRAYARAKNLERAGDERAALVAYVELSTRANAVAEDALFSILRLHAAHGKRAAIRAAIEQYRKRFPNGRYARDVDVHALNLATAEADRAAMRRECEAFLGRFPDDPRAWRFRLVQARERAAEGDCAQALELLSRVPDSAAKQAVLSACPQP